jgi:hypothetical protein
MAASGGAALGDLARRYEQSGGQLGGGAAPSASTGAFAGLSLGALGAGWSPLRQLQAGGQYLRVGGAGGAGGAAVADIEEGGAAEAGTAGDALSGASSLASLSRAERFKGFVALLLLSGFFFVLSMVFLSVVVLFPGKFALSFSMGSLCFMGAFALLQGPAAWAARVCSAEQAPFTAAYLGSIVATLYACLVWRSYVLVVLLSGAQFAALGYYAFGNMPGGQYGLRLVAATAKQLAVSVCWPCAKGLARLCQGVMSRQLA